MRSLLQGRSFQALDLLLGAVDSLSANRDIEEAMVPETLTSFAQHHVKELFHPWSLRKRVGNVWLAYQL